MLEYNRIDISEGIDVNKTNLSNDCDICHYWYLRILVLNMNLIFIMDVIMQKAMSFNNIAIVYVNGSAYRIHFWYMSKDDAVNIMNGSNLADKRGVL